MGEEACVLKVEAGTWEYDGVRYGVRRWASATSAVAHAVAPVVLLHGFAQSAKSWNDVATAFTATRVVYGLELVGHGASDRPADATAYALERQANALHAFLKHVSEARDDLFACSAEGKNPSNTSKGETSLNSVEGDASPSIKDKTPPSRALPAVVGYSMGGRVALAAATHDPQAFATCTSGLILEAAGLGPATKEEREAAAARDTANAEALRTSGVPAFMDTWERLPLFATQRELPVATRERLHAGRLNNSAEALARTFEHAGQHTMPARERTLEALATLRALNFPVSYLAGSCDTKYAALAKELAAAHLCETRIIEGAGHNVHLEAPTAFVREVTALLSVR